MDIYLNNGKESKGPYPEDAVRQFLADGQIDGSELAWHEGLDGWVNVKELAKDVAPAPVGPEPFAPAPDPFATVAAPGTLVRAGPKIPRYSFPIEERIAKAPQGICTKN